MLKLFTVVTALLITGGLSYLPAQTPRTKIPRVIQGGMGIRISKWELAREVQKAGELGVVSGTGIDTIFVRELQDGDPEGSMRRALASFPDQ
eukprot:12358251-Ditylum_brightwellii.AAC.1